MKHLMSLCLVFVMLFAFAGCGNDNNGDTVSTVETESKEQISTQIQDDEEPQIKEITVETLNSMESTPGSSFEYLEYDDNGGIIIDKFVGTEEIVVIPSEIDDKPVKAIGNSSFSFNETLRAVKIPDSVEIIESSAFQSSKKIEIVIFGKSVKVVEDSAFNMCQSLKTIILNEGLEKIDSLAFTLAAFKEIEIPSTVTYIDDMAFSKSFDFQRVFIGEPGSVTEQYVNKVRDSENFAFKAKE